MVPAWTGCAHRRSGPGATPRRATKERGVAAGAGFLVPSGDHAGPGPVPGSRAGRNAGEPSSSHARAQVAGVGARVTRTAHRERRARLAPVTLMEGCRQAGAAMSRVERRGGRAVLVALVRGNLPWARVAGLWGLVGWPCFSLAVGWTLVRRPRLLLGGTRRPAVKDLAVGALAPMIVLFAVLLLVEFGWPVNILAAAGLVLGEATLLVGAERPGWGLGPRRMACGRNAGAHGTARRVEEIGGRPVLGAAAGARARTTAAVTGNGGGRPVQGSAGTGGDEQVSGARPVRQVGFVAVQG